MELSLERIRGDDGEGSQLCRKYSRLSFDFWTIETGARVTVKSQELNTGQWRFRSWATRERSSAQILSGLHLLYQPS
jgi:hypothetical protein